MAGVAYVKIRLWNPGRANIFGDETNVLNFLERAVMHDGKSVKQPYFEILWISATQAGEELGTAATSDKDGTAVPFQITVVSSDNTKDLVDGVGAQRTAIIGVSVSSIAAYQGGEKPVLGVEVVDINGTTDVLSTRWYLHHIHSYICSVGSEGDPVGNIQIESPANTVLQSILATNMESNGCILYFVEGDYAKVDRVIIAPTAALAAGDGVVLTINELAWEGRYHILEDFPADSYTFIHYDGSPVDVKEAWPFAKRATKYSSLKFTETLIANTQTIKIHCTVNIHK